MSQLWHGGVTLRQEAGSMIGQEMPDTGWIKRLHIESSLCQVAISRCLWARSYRGWWSVLVSVLSGSGVTVPKSRVR